MKRRVIDRPDLRALTTYGEVERLRGVLAEIHRECELYCGITPLGARWDRIKALARDGAKQEGDGL